MAESTRDDVPRGLAWTAFSRGVAFGGGAVVGIALTRMLDPASIGTLSLALVTAGVIEATSAVGLSRHLVQQETVDPIGIDTAFWGDLGFAVLGGLVVAALAPVAGWWYAEPGIVLLLLALSATIPLTGLVKTQRNLAFREMRFGTVARAEVWASAASVVAALAALAAGAGIWAVVLREVLRRALIAVTLWTALAWRPRLRFSREAFRASFGFGSRLLGVELIRTLAAGADQLVVGRAFGLAEVGVYSRGQNLVIAPLQQVTSVAGTVLFPAFSRIADEAELAAAYVRAVGGVLFLFVPCCLALWLVGEDAVVVVLGERWRASADVLRILAPVVLWRSASELLRSVYNARGRTDLTLRTTLIGQGLLIACVIAGAWQGVLGVAVGHVVGSALGTALEQATARALIGVRWRALAKLAAELAIPAVLAAGAGWALRGVLPEGALRLVAVGAVVGVVFVAAAAGLGVSSVPRRT